MGDTRYEWAGPGVVKLGREYFGTGVPLPKDFPEKRLAEFKKSGQVQVYRPPAKKEEPKKPEPKKK